MFVNAPTFDQVSRLIRLDPDGTLRWLENRGSVKAGDVAGHVNKDGYIGVRLMGKSLLAHRVVWLLSTGVWPDGMLDHIDGVRTNNAPDNLRVCSSTENQRNRLPRSWKRYKGVSWNKSVGKFQAQCDHVYLGVFDTEEEAAKAYDRAAAEKYGEFARPNFKEAA